MNLYHCSVIIALDAGPCMAGHVKAETPAEAKAIFEVYFFGYKTEGLPVSSAEHIEQCKRDARESWFTVKASKSNAPMSNAIN